MTENHLPAAIADFIEATNRGDSDAFVATFTQDAYLNDGGREFHGHDGVRAWNRTDNIGVRSHFDLGRAEPADRQSRRAQRRAGPAEVASGHMPALPQPPRSAEGRSRGVISLPAPGRDRKPHLIRPRDTARRRHTLNTVLARRSASTPASA